MPIYSYLLLKFILKFYLKFKKLLKNTLITDIICSLYNIHKTRYYKKERQN